MYIPKVVLIIIVNVFGIFATAEDSSVLKCFVFKKFTKYCKIFVNFLVDRLV